MLSLTQLGGGEETPAGSGACTLGRGCSTAASHHVIPPQCVRRVCSGPQEGVLGQTGLPLMRWSKERQQGLPASVQSGTSAHCLHRMYVPEDTSLLFYSVIN